MAKSHFFLLVIVSLFISSCDLIDNILDRGDSKFEGCYLQKTSWSLPGDPAHGSTEYFYDSDGNLIEIIKTDYDLDELPYIDRKTFSYLNGYVDQIKTYSTFYSNPESTDTEYHFTYNNNNLPDSIISYYESKITSCMVASYKGNKISKLISYRYNPNDLTYFQPSTSEIEWTGDNVSKVTTAYGSVVYEYDDKKNPTLNSGLALSFNSFISLSLNNVVKQVYTPNNGDVSVNEYTYTYNDSDYPLSSQWIGYLTTIYEYN